MAYKKRGPVVEEAVETKSVPTPKAVKTRKIIIDEQDGVEAKDVFVSVQGKAYVIKRGEIATVPEGVYYVLRDSVYEILVKEEDGSERIKKVPRFPMREV